MPLIKQSLADVALALLRFAAGSFLLVLHGWAKITAAAGYLFAGHPWRFVHAVESIGFPMPGFFAVMVALSEFLGGLLFAVGLFTRPAAAAIAITMTVAFLRHLTTDGRIELPALYLLVAVVFLFSPTNPISLDGKLKIRMK